VTPKTQLTKIKLVNGDWQVVDENIHEVQKRLKQHSLPAFLCKGVPVLINSAQVTAVVELRG